MYEYTDKVIHYLNKRFIRIFSRAKSNLLQMDELNILNYSKSLYAELEKITEDYFLEIAQKAYKDASGTREITRKWLREFLSEYDPVTMYVYLNEVDRKRDRFAESVVSSVNKSREVERGLRYWSRMISQYAVETADKAVIQAYKENGTKKVIWVTTEDERTCLECLERDGMVYDIEDIPPKPHINCRCYVLPYGR